MTIKAIINPEAKQILKREFVTKVCFKIVSSLYSFSDSFLKEFYAANFM
jgi:hypothetical protein